MGFIKRWLIKRALKKAKEKSDMEKIADDVLKDAMTELQQTGRTADKILKAKLIRQESQHALKKINELDDDLDDDEEEEAPQPNMQETITSALLMKLLGGGAPAGAPAQPKGEITGYDEKGNPMYAEVIPEAPPQAQAAPQSANSANVSDIVKNLKPADVEALKRKFLG